MLTVRCGQKDFLIKYLLNKKFFYKYPSLIPTSEAICPLDQYKLLLVGKPQVKSKWSNLLINIIKLV